MPSMTTNCKYIPLQQLREIRDNGYRSKDASRDYYPELIEDEINRKIANNLNKRLKMLEDEEEQQFVDLGDDLRSFLRVLNTKGSQFLSDETLKLIVRDLGPRVADYK